MERFSTVKREENPDTEKELPVQYCVFDILRYRGVNVTSLPLLDRKALLQEAIKEQDHLCLLRWTEGQGKELFDLLSARVRGYRAEAKGQPVSHWEML